MRTLVALGLALAPLAAQADPGLLVSGTCPGEVTIDITGLTPGGTAQLLFGPALGADPIPAGRCAGTATTLSPAWWVTTAPDRDGDGAVSFNPTVPSSACTKYLQVLDAASCTLSEPFLVGDAAPPTVSDLGPGDLLIIGFNSDAPDDWAFVSMVNIAAGVSIFFTDNGVFADGSLRATEGSVEWITPDVVPAGTVLTAIDLGLDGLALSTSGDQVIAYQGELDLPSVYVYGLNVDGADWAPEADASTNSALPLGLVNGDTAVSVPESDNVIFVPLTDTLTRAELRAQVGDPANWVGDNTTPFDLAATLPAAFTFTD